MTAPETSLDARYSEPNVEPTSWEDTRAALERAELFWLTTVRADGRPHTTPVVAVWLDDALHFTTGADEQKAKNLRASPHVVVTTGCNGWESGLDVVVEGDAVHPTDSALLARVAEAFHAKWDGQWQFVVKEGGFFHPSGSEVQLFSVLPSKVLAFAKGPFSHTTHRFS
jgi:PPOX class probable F420-dependent enzyme